MIIRKIYYYLSLIKNLFFETVYAFSITSFVLAQRKIFIFLYSFFYFFFVVDMFEKYHSYIKNNFYDYFKHIEHIKFSIFDINIGMISYFLLIFLIFYPLFISFFLVIYNISTCIIDTIITYIEYKLFKNIYKD